jgi:hypothetical protein
MAKINSKDKGSSFERKIANILSERFEPMLQIKNSFRRNQDSGSFFGGTNQQRTQSYSLDYAVFGDIICPRSFRFSVECKHYKTPPTFKSVVSQSVTQWDSWLRQAEQDAASSSKQMSLIVKYNNVDSIIFLHSELPNIKHTTYQQYHIHLLSDWLSSDDQYFFDLISP